MKMFSQERKRRDACMIASVFEVKKKIPTKSRMAAVVDDGS